MNSKEIPKNWNFYVCKGFFVLTSVYENMHVCVYVCMYIPHEKFKDPF